MPAPPNRRLGMMPAALRAGIVDRAWLPCCILDALTHFAILARLLPEAVEAARNALSDAAA